MRELCTAEEALTYAGGGSQHPLGRSASFVCPHCGSYAEQFWGWPNSLTLRVTSTNFLSRQIGEKGFVMALCAVCRHESVFKDGKLIYPESNDAPKAVMDMPVEVLDDFNEASAILSKSPRGAAALLRLAIQKLCPLIGAKQGDINSMIGQLVKDGKIPATVQQALDSVRVIGNEAVHPGTIDLKDDVKTASTLFRLVNFIVEKAITEPKEIAQIYDSLPKGKLDGIAQRDMSADESQQLPSFLKSQDDGPAPPA